MRCCLILFQPSGSMASGRSSLKTAHHLAIRNFHPKMFTKNNFHQKNFHPKKFSPKKIFTQKIFTQIVRLSFVDLRWAQLYVSLVFTVVLPSKAILPYGNSITFETALKVLIYNQGNFESREKERRAWIPDFHTCLYVRSHFFIFFWIILNSQFYTPPTPHLAKPAQTWLILSTFWAIVLSRENWNWQNFQEKNIWKDD